MKSVLCRCQDVGLLGERGSKVPNATIGQLSIEVEVAMTLNLEYSRLAACSSRRQALESSCSCADPCMC